MEKTVEPAPAHGPARRFAPSLAGEASRSTREDIADLLVSGAIRLPDTEPASCLVLGLGLFSGRVGGDVAGLREGPLQEMDQLLVQASAVLGCALSRSHQQPSGRGSSTSGNFSMRQNLSTLGINTTEDVGSLFIVE